MRKLRNLALLAALVLGLANSTCRVKSDNHSDDDEQDDGRTQTFVVLPAPVQGVAPVLLPVFPAR